MFYSQAQRIYLFIASAGWDSAGRDCRQFHMFVIIQEFLSLNNQLHVPLQILTLISAISIWSILIPWK